MGEAIGLVGGSGFLGPGRYILQLHHIDWILFINRRLIDVTVALDIAVIGVGAERRWMSLLFDAGVVGVTA